MPEVHLNLENCQQQQLEVRLSVTPRQTSLGLQLPSWTPGSYLIRDYVRHLEGLEVWQAGNRLAIRRQTPSRWQLDLDHLAPLAISYRVHAAELSVRTCHLSPDHGFLALAAVVLEVEGERWHPHQLSLSLPPGWHSFIPLPEGAGHWLAKDFDQLIDSPVEVGPHRQHDFEVAGVPHRWVTWGKDLAGQELTSADPNWLIDVAKVCDASCALMGESRPAADSYLFVLHLTESGYGGLEHDQSTVLQFSRKALAKPDGRRKLLQLVAHEYLHQWNVRRLRPAELTPYNYGEAAVVPTLWFAEGITSYFDQLVPHAAGISSEEALLEDLGTDLSRYLLTPGRQVQSLLSSGQEAWVKLYKADADAPNSQISYYLKGAVVALVLDLHLRRHGACLPQVLRALWASHGRGGRGYQQGDLQAAFTSLAPDLQTLLPQWLNGTDDPPLGDYLADVGLQLQAEPGKHLDLGWQCAQSNGLLSVTRIRRHGPASEAGVIVGDELLALDDERLGQVEDLELLLAPEFLGERQLLLARDGRVRQLKVSPQPPAPCRWSLVPMPMVSEAMLEARRRWLTLQPPRGQGL
ncbi:M61 family metallopeptidase [Cyanobium sp. HWJ4-Hawea]|uniref:M61 family metallopeptidase n=1 Tax=Cyanobium sp. HWJ4-Hawea TaxID=2823713 RepID=UPI0020CC9F15|nr:PDZ domain-containing protein [Cyanobium sp. HWJ4-Hawea]MCP9809602.1 M61 family metallopeptidase [Cyanobium sp. HWJ4-Hawea]